MIPKKKMNDTLIYFLILGFGTVLIFCAGVYDKSVSRKKELAREVAAKTAEDERKAQAERDRAQAERDKADMIRVVVAARAVQQQAQQVIDEKTTHAPAASKSFTSVDAALQEATSALAIDTAKELEVAQKTIASQNAWRREVQKWNKIVDPFVIDGVKAIEDTLQKASSTSNQFPIRAITKTGNYPYSFGWDLDKTPDTTDLFEVDFTSGVHWKIFTQRGYVGYQDPTGIPSPLQFPSLTVSWNIPGSGSGSSVFYFDKDGHVKLLTSDEVFPGAAAIKEKYKDNGLELIGNMIVEMLRRTNIRSLAAEAAKTKPNP